MVTTQKPFYESSDSRVEAAYTAGVEALQRGQYQLADQQFRDAAAAGHVSALYNMAILNGAGYISPYNLDLAIDCFYKAAAAGHPTASELRWQLDAADRGGFGTQNLARFAAQLPHEDGLNHIIMMCAARFYDVLCKQHGAATDVIAYELDAASRSDNPAVQRFLQRTGLPESFYQGGLDRLVRGSAADQITDGLNQLHLGLRQSGMSDDLCLMARCTIVGHLILKSAYASRAQPLLGIDDFLQQPGEGGSAAAESPSPASAPAPRPQAAAQPPVQDQRPPPRPQPGSHRPVRTEQAAPPAPTPASHHAPGPPPPDDATTRLPRAPVITVPNEEVAKKSRFLGLFRRRAKPPSPTAPRTLDEATALFAEHDADQAWQVVRDAADGGSLFCQVMLSNAGLAIPVDERTPYIQQQTEHYTRLAAEGGDAASQFNTAKFHIARLDSRAKFWTEEDLENVRQAKFWHRKAAAQGYQPSVLALRNLECFDV